MSEDWMILSEDIYDCIILFMGYFLSILKEPYKKEEVFISLKTTGNA